jgi:hypothetical protein
VDGVSGGPPIVVLVRVERRAVSVDPTVAIEGQGEEGGGSVAAGEDLAQGATFDRSAG